jgi:hypothetical protein
MDSDVAFLSGCPFLETLHIFFDPRSLTEVPVPSSSKRLKFNDGNFSWTCLEIDSNWLDSMTRHYRTKVAHTTLGIIGNVQSVVEAYLDVFSPRESKFVDPILNRFRMAFDSYYLLLRHSKSKVNLYYYDNLYVFVYIYLH